MGRVISVSHPAVRGAARGSSRTSARGMVLTPDGERRMVRDRHVPEARAARARASVHEQTPTIVYVLGVVIALLVLLGLVMVLSASSITSFHRGGSPWGYFTKQLIWASVGTAGLVAAYLIRLETWRRLARIGYVLALGSMILPFVPGLGRSVDGAHAWVAVGELGFQPSEVLKLAALLFVADLLTRRERAMSDLRLTLLPSLLVLSLSAGLCVVQGDLGSAVVIGAIVFVVLFAAGSPAVPLAASAAGIATVGLLFVASSPRRYARWTAFLDLEANKEHTSYQVYQAIVSIANGGPTGVGVGAGTGKWGYVPLAHSDFIFAIIAEELGLFGTVAVIGGIALVAVLGVVVAIRAGDAGDRFAMLVAGGISVWFAVQAAINIGGVTGVMPVTGLTLPFISFGGSSLLVSMVAAGILLNVARARR